MILLGLAVFAAASFVAAAAPDLFWIVVGRSLQGAGAVSAAVTALLADQTRDEVRTKAMALVGASIGLMFAVSLVAAPAVSAHIGLAGLFVVTGLLALACMGVVAWWTPPEPAVHKEIPRGRLAEVLRHPPLLRLNVGVFVLHAVQLAMWVAVPALLVQAGLPKERHWVVYLPAVLASFVAMSATLFPLERRGYLRAVFLASIGLVGLVQVALAVAAAQPGLALLGAALFVFFWGFNILEATRPSMAPPLAPRQAPGPALGVYNTLQSLGFFFGGAVGGWLVERVGAPGLFAACAGLTGLWLAVAWPMRAPPRPKSAEEVLADEARAT